MPRTCSASCQKLYTSSPSRSGSPAASGLPQSSSPRSDTPHTAGRPPTLWPIAHSLPSPTPSSVRPKHPPATHTCPWRARRGRCAEGVGTAVAGPAGARGGADCGSGKAVCLRGASDDAAAFVVDGWGGCGAYCCTGGVACFAFSCSNSFSRFAWSICNPPYSLRQRKYVCSKISAPCTPEHGST